MKASTANGGAAAASKAATLQERIRKAEAVIEKEKQQFGQQALSTAISFGATLAGALFGRKVASIGNVSKAGTAVRGIGRSNKERGDIARARDTHKALIQQLEDLNIRLEGELEQLKAKYNPEKLEIKETAIRPRKTDTDIQLLTLVWTPWSIDPDGVAEKLF